MAVSFDYKTYGLLDAWRKRMRVSDWHFNQITGTGVDAPIATPGQQVWVQPDRDGLVEGIVTALAAMVRELGFYHRPVFVEDDITVTGDLPIYRQVLTSNWRYVQAIGRRGLTVIQAGAPVVYTYDSGVPVLATVTVNTTLTDVQEIQAFFRPADSLDDAADERWQIEPLKVVANGVTATLTGHPSLFVTPALWRTPYAAPNYNSASKIYGLTTDVTNFVTTVDVYRVYPDPTNAITITCQNPSCSSCQPVTTTYDGGGVILDSVQGALRLHPSNCCSGCAGSWRGVRKVHIALQAGYPLNSFGLVEPPLQLALVRLANAETPYKLPTSDARENYWHGDIEVYPQGTLPPGLLENPLGVRVGQVEAWKIMMGYLIGDGGVLGGFFRG